MHKLPELQAHYKIWLSLKNGDGILGDGKWQLLSKINELGSISKAAEAIGISYRKAWGNLKKMEVLLNIPIIQKQRGGAKGGGCTVLTENGIKIITIYSKFHNNIELSFNNTFRKFLTELKNV